MMILVETPGGFRQSRAASDRRGGTPPPGTLGVLALLAAVLLAAGPVPAPSESPRSVERELKALLDSGAQHSSDPQVLVRLAGLYLDMGDDLYMEADKRKAAYEAGAGLAKRALELHEPNAEAHYLYAANLGSAAQLKGVMASAFTVRDLKSHVSRALELRPDHAPSLHMMGMMLEELPWMLGGDRAAALIYLQRAVAVDPNDEHARLDLAKAYLKRQNREAAERELRTILKMSDRLASQVRVSRHVAEATRLLAEMEPAAGSGARP